VTRAVVGNDVVDLTDPAIAEHHTRISFLSRVCAADEMARVATALDLWTLFAAKEAAYKALVKLGISPGFAHRDIRVDPALRKVHWLDHELELSVTSDENHVHAVAWSPPARPPIAMVARADAQGGGARKLLCELVAGTLGCMTSELEVVRDPVAGAWDGFGPPRVNRGGIAIDADVSLSDDGPFVAAAVFGPV
jgi:phosphopantetheinyl transferase (holo-ACP synthase)